MNYVYISPEDQMYLAALEYYFYEITGVNIDVFIAAHYADAAHYANME